jgi:hypothetical protein
MTRRLAAKSNGFFLEQRAFFHTQLIREQKRSRLVVSALHVKLNFVRKVRREPRAAHNADFIARKTEFRDGLCETNEIIDRGLSHSQPPCISPIDCRERERPNHRSDCIAQPPFSQRSFSGNPIPTNTFSHSLRGMQV